MVSYILGLRIIFFIIILFHFFRYTFLNIYHLLKQIIPLSKFYSDKSFYHPKKVLLSFMIILFFVEILDKKLSHFDNRIFV